MALLFMDSFDHYAFADFTTKWTSFIGGYNGTEASGIVATAGRRGGSAVRFQTTGTSAGAVGGALLTLQPTSNKIVVGFAFTSVSTFLAWAIANTGAEGNGFGTPPCLLNVRNAGVAQAWIRLNTDGTLSAMRPTSGSASVTIGPPTSASLVQAVYTYIEIAMTIDATVGAVAIRFNGVTVMNQTGVNTVGFGTALNAWNAIRIGPMGFTGALPNVEIRYDDLYVLDGSGAAPWNTFLGDCRVEAMSPSGPGANTGWTPSAGANWQCVDDAAPNGDADYTAAATAGLTDTFATQDLLAAGTTVYGVQHCLSAKKADAGAASLAPVIRHGGTDYPGAVLNPNTGYNVLMQIAQVNPGTSAQWTMADFNAAEFGYRRTV
jgi:hypothetical protein